jgi:hypothetical protein
LHLSYELNIAAESFDDPIVSLLTHARDRLQPLPGETALPFGSVTLPPIDGLSHEEVKLLQGWSTGDVERVALRQQYYASKGIHEIKRDIEPKLDPVRQGLLSEFRISELFEAQVQNKSGHTDIPAFGLT